MTRYPNSCFTAVTSQLPESNTTTDPLTLFKLSLRVAIDEVTKLTQLPPKLRAAATDPLLQKGIDVCTVVINDSLDRINDSLDRINNDVLSSSLTPAVVSDVETWLSAAITDHETCLDAIREVNSPAAGGVLQEIETAMRNSTKFTSNNLAIVTRIIGVLSEFDTSNHNRRLLGEFPEWVGAAERRILAAVLPVPDVVVAKDGSGQFKTIGEALKGVTKKSNKRFVVYVKKGIYVENIELDKNTWNVMIYGDGMTKTVISGGLNFIDGTPTFHTATFATNGKGFIAKGIKFMNTAGAAKHQAVAMRSDSDYSVFYKCSFDCFQDTLYAHANRQFYRDCDITGTIDFIFGNAAAIFQNCNITPREPMPNQYNTITAQGKEDPDQKTGFVIQNSTITPLAPTYLGRPWKVYSTTVFMQNKITGSLLKPEGWVSWDGSKNPPPRTIFYAEYQNSGPGADVSQRVRWVGYKSTLSANDVVKFSVSSFIQGRDWLPNAGVEFN